VLYGGVSDIAGAYKIGLHAFDRIFLHQRHMFQRCRVEYHLGPEPTEKARNPALIPDVHDRGDDIQVRIALAQFCIEFIEMEFRTVGDDQPPRPKIGDLAAEFGSDGPAGASDKYDLAVNQTNDVLQIGGDFRPRIRWIRRRQ